MPAKLSNSVKLSKIRAIMPFKVIQGHRCLHQPKDCMRYPVSDSNWHPISYCFQVIANGKRPFCAFEPPLGA